MSVKVAKEFRWEMGHRLPYHETCRNIHGHSYRMVVEVTGDVDETGMLIDFGDISCLVRPILDQLDHSFMVDPTDELMTSVLRDSGLKKTVVPFYSTAENISQWILDQLWAQLSSRGSVQSLSIQIFETATSSATAAVSR